MQESDKNIRIPAKGEAGKHTGHEVRTVVVSASKGIKGLYCIEDKNIITYISAKNKGWTVAKTKKWMSEHNKNLKELNPIEVDQEPEFLKIVATMVNGETEEYIPNSASFELTKEIEAATTGIEDYVQCQKCGIFIDYEDEVEKGMGDIECPECGEQIDQEGNILKARGQGQGVGGQRQGDGGADKCVCPKCGEEIPHEKGTPCGQSTCPKCGSTMVGKAIESDKQSENRTIEVIKLDKAKQIVYGVFLWPDKADHDGDVISGEDVEKVAHKFLVDYRDVDECHKAETIKADVVESMIAWEDGIDFYGKTLVKGVWFGSIKIHDLDVWNKVVSGEYTAFSVRITGIREPIK